MPQARFVVTLPERTCFGELSAAFPETTFKIHTALGDETRGVGLCWLTTPDSERVLDALDEHEDISPSVVFHQTATEAALQFEAAGPFLLRVALETGVLIEFPVEVRDGRAVLDVLGDATSVTAFGARLESLETAFTLEFVREYDGMDTELTQKQHALVSAAVELGYYDTPRTCSLTELAETVDLAKSTVSETLHRAEGTIVKTVLKTAGQDGPRSGDSVTN